MLGACSKSGFVEQREGLQAVVWSPSALLAHQSGRPLAELVPEQGGEPFLRIRVPRPKCFQEPRQLLTLVPFHRIALESGKKFAGLCPDFRTTFCRERYWGIWDRDPLDDRLGC